MISLKISEDEEAKQPENKGLLTLSSTVSGATSLPSDDEDDTTDADIGAIEEEYNDNSNKSKKRHKDGKIFRSITATPKPNAKSITSYQHDDSIKFKKRNRLLLIMVFWCIMLVGLVMCLYHFLRPKQSWQGSIEHRNSNKTEIERVSEAETLCNPKKCCREDDNVETDSSECAELAYLECLAADNACVWDCSQGHHGENDLHYIREFKGISGHNAHYIGIPQSSPEEDDVNKDTVDPNLIIETVDECGTMYEYHLTEQDRIREAERVRNISYTHQETLGGDTDIVDVDGNRRRLINLNGMTPSGEMDETLRRKLAVMGYDGRTDVTTTTDPYYKVVFITFQSVEGLHSCSGVLITVKHVLTAGHCISDGYGHYYWNWKVYPNYKAGYSTQFTVYESWLLHGWHTYRDFNYDIGILTLDTTNTGFGHFSFGYSTSITSRWDFGVAGYPGDKYYMQRQNTFMDYDIDYNLLKTRTGDIVRGNSGGPVYLDSSKGIYAVVSHEALDPYTGICIYNGFTTITKEKFNAMCSYIGTFSETSHYTDYIS